MNSEDDLPSHTDIAGGDLSDLDAQWAARTYGGKTVEQAEALFDHDTSLCCTQSFYSMKGVGLRYYLQAAIRYALSERSSNDPDFINGLAGSLRFRLEHDRNELQPCAGQLAEVCEYVARNFERYDAKPEIYIGLRDVYRALVKEFTHLAVLKDTAGCITGEEGDEFEKAVREEGDRIHPDDWK